MSKINTTLKNKNEINKTYVLRNAFCDSKHTYNNFGTLTSDEKTITALSRKLVLFNLSTIFPMASSMARIIPDNKKKILRTRQAKYKYRGMFETQKVRRHDKFRKEWSQH